MRAGLNYVDTSPFYGEGKSEEVLGRMMMILKMFKILMILMILMVLGRMAMMVVILMETKEAAIDHLHLCFYR